MASIGLGRVLLSRVPSLTRTISSAGSLHSKVAVVLSGCGVYDGSEIHEASAILVHLSRHRAEVAMFAPDMQQMHVIDHLVGEPVHTEIRNVLEESARIARGKISPLSKLDVSDYDAVVFPGGFGAAKHLSSFALEGAGMKVDEEAERVLKEFHRAGKPIGLCCISPVLAAKVFPGVEVTVGSSSDAAAEAIKKMGATHVERLVSETHTDDRYKVVTTPAFMYEAPLHEIFDGIGSMISKVMEFTE